MIKTVKGSKILTVYESFIVDKIVNLLIEHLKFLPRRYLPIINYKSHFLTDFREHLLFYNIQNRGDLQFNDFSKVLAPEYTALVNKFDIGNCWYFQPCFRYENTQKLRLREFYQFGVEINFNHTLINLIFSKLYLIFNILKLKNVKLFYNYISGPQNSKSVISPLEDRIDKKGMIYDTSLFRGLGYYDGFVFELHCDDVEFGGGGTYKTNNNLNFGFALGIFPRLIEIIGINYKLFNLVFRNKYIYQKKVLDFFFKFKYTFIVTTSIITENNFINLEFRNDNKIILINKTKSIFFDLNKLFSYLSNYYV